MRFISLAASSLLALSLVACGSGDDSANNEPGKDSLPPKPQECIDAGDKCVLKDGQWVVPKKDDNKPDPKDDPAPVADSSFDYSDIGVTDKVGPIKKGFAFYNKGSKSALDANPEVFKNNPLQKPTINWSSTKEYDDDLYNFVAIMSGGDQKQKGKDADKFMFDKIGEVNHSENQNVQFFGGGDAASSFYGVGNSAIKISSSNEYYANKIPALVNSFMYRNADGKLTYRYENPDKKTFYNQEEDLTSSTGSGAKKSRVYGLNAFFKKVTTGIESEFADAKNGATGTSTTLTKYKFENRDTSTEYYSGANFVWYDVTTWGKRKGVTKIKDGTFTHAIKHYDAQHPFPTDVKFGALNYVQFGRLTGEGIDPEAEGLDEYDKKVKPYNFSESTIKISDSITPGGNDKTENWYFGRGIKPTTPEYLEQIKNANGGNVVYNGQAVMFGIDYRLTANKDENKPEDKKGQSTNSVIPLDRMTEIMFPLDGKHNFVRMTWNPSDGTMKGEVYGVWTLGKFIVSNTKWENGPGNDVVPNDFIKLDATNLTKVTYKTGEKGITIDKTKEGDEFAHATSGANLVEEHALKLQPLRHIHVKLDGVVTPGTNSFSGSAVRCKDGDKGLFAGAFFGPQGNEITGVINSQTGLMSNKDLTDPANMWGGAFGAQKSANQAEEDLFFEEKVHDYGTSTEFFN